jgi:starvation-inducible DNA-binding protein
VLESLFENSWALDDKNTLSVKFFARNPMTKTKNDLPAKARTEMIDLLNARLSDAIDLELQTKQAHWNVKGPNFIALHELFDKLAEEVEEHIDEIAERAVQLGGTAYGTVQAVQSSTQLQPYPTDIVDSDAHVAALSDAYAAFAKSVRAAIETADKVEDKGTSDLFTQISRNADKALWFIESHAREKS